MLLLDDDSDKRELKKIVDVANAPTRGPSVISSLFLLYDFKKCHFHFDDFGKCMLILIISFTVEFRNELHLSSDLVINKPIRCRVVQLYRFPLLLARIICFSFCSS